jgi:hypothetical protein
MACHSHWDRLSTVVLATDHAAEQEQQTSRRSETRP